MAGSYKTPGVYVEEISTLPASVAQVETAIPAFIGYTQRSPETSELSGIEAIRISSMMEYEANFGGPEMASFTVAVNENAQDGNVTSRSINAQLAKALRFKMYYGVKMYFDNGGGPCYILSVGAYGQSGVSDEALKAGLQELEKEDEPTLILFPDAGSMEDANKYYALQAASLAQCAKLQDRFALIDLHGEDPEKMRNTLSSDYLKFGAAYHPNLLTTLAYQYQASDVSIEHTVNGSSGDLQGKKLSEIQQANVTDTAFVPEGTSSEAGTVAEAVAIIDQITSAEAIDTYVTGETRKGVNDAASARKAAIEAQQASALGYYNEIYHQVLAALKKMTVTVTPSPVMAGVYARVDSDRGVWKAPANVSVSNVVKPTMKITNEMQAGLNVDPASGKSINAIRAFAGKGILVWGARTLAGNDNEWKYIPVRRLFNMVEESLKKATGWVVFEPNDANTWVRVKAQIENFLTGLWRDQALAGASPGDAFFVNVGLGTTMTPQDVLEGNLIIEIGMAAVRPAEFIILRFSHKLQE